MVGPVLPRVPETGRPDWLVIADGYLGLAEVPGPTSNPVILGWAHDLGGWITSFFTDDDIAWCALFVNACLEKAGIAGTHSLAAASFVTWGTGLAAPHLGAILTFTRPGGNHVGFYLGESTTHYLVRGGNQSNRVRDSWIPKGRRTSMRWPDSRIIPLGDGQIWVPMTAAVMEGSLG